MFFLWILEAVFSYSIASRVPQAPCCWQQCVGSFSFVLFLVGQFWGDLGAILWRLGRSWGRLVASWAILWPSWCDFEAILEHLRLSWGHLGAILNHLGAILGHVGAIWGHLGATLGPSWAREAAGVAWINEARDFGPKTGPQNGPKTAPKRSQKLDKRWMRFRRLLECILERFLALLGLSWEALGSKKRNNHV